MSDNSVKICNTIIQEEEYYSNKKDEYLLKKNDLDSKYKNSLIGVVVTCIFFIILLIIGIILLVIKSKKNKNIKNDTIDVKKILAVVFFIIALLCSFSSVGLGYLTNKNKNERDILVEPIIDDKYRPCYSSTQKKLIIDLVDAPKNRNQIGLDLSGFGVGGLSGSLGSFVYSEEKSNMQDASDNSLTTDLNRDKQLSYSARTSSDSSAEASTNLSNTQGNTTNSTSNASASGGTTSQVDLSLL